MQGMWYAVQTLTSLGYGDFTPQTFLGKVGQQPAKKNIKEQTESLSAVKIQNCIFICTDLDQKAVILQYEYSFLKHLTHSIQFT